MFIPLTHSAIDKINNDARGHASYSNNHQGISTTKNTITWPKIEDITTIHNPVVSTTSESPAAQVAKLKSTKLK